MDKRQQENTQKAGQYCEYCPTEIEFNYPFFNKSIIKIVQRYE